VNALIWVLAALSICSTVCLSFLTKVWFSSDTSFRNFCTEPSTILVTISAGLPLSAAFSAAILRSLSTSSAGTSACDSAAGFIAATCIATSLAATSSPVNSTSTPMRVPCR
jgi:hypothetical protein